MMNNMMEQMMGKMMEQMMPKMMETMMTSMMNAMMGAMSAPQVAPAEVEAPAKQEAMSLEDFLAMDTSNEVAESSSKKTSNSVAVDFECESFMPRNARKSRMGLKYNQYVSKSVWAYNHLQIKAKYPDVKYSNGHYYCEKTSDLQNFAGSYHIVTKLNDEQMAEVRAYWDSRKSK